MATLSHSTIVCRQCKAELPMDMFYRTKHRSGRYYADNTCKTCRSAMVQDRRQVALADPGEAERRKLWRREHKRKLRQQSGCISRAELKVRAEAKNKARAAHKARPRDHDAHVKRWREVIRARDGYRAKAVDPAYLAKVAERKRKRLAENPDARERNLLYLKAWLRTDKGRALSKRMRKRRLSTPKGQLDRLMGRYIRGCLGSKKRGRSWKSVVGYDANDLMRHLERQFVKGMGWHNRKAWHIDHIVPRASFKYQSAECAEFKACWALANLQPLWAEANIRKRDERQTLL